MSRVQTHHREEPWCADYYYEHSSSEVFTERHKKKHKFIRNILIYAPWTSPETLTEYNLVF